MDETKSKITQHVDGHKMVMTFIFITVTAVIFLGIGYLAGKNSAETSEVAVVSETAVATTGTVIGTTTATGTTTVAESTVSIATSEAASAFCQKNATDGNEVKKVNYQEANGSAFVDCSIGGDIGGHHTIGKVIDGAWINIWQGNGDMTCDIVNKYSIPTTINTLGCV